MHEYTSTVRIWELTCPGFLEEVGRARRWTRDILNGNPHVDDAALIVTELSTNALLHSNSGYSQDSFCLTLTLKPDTLTITVADSGGSHSKPRMERPNANTLHGRGLALVAALADHLQVRGGTDGHIITATLDNRNPTIPDETATLTPPSPEHQPC